MIKYSQLKELLVPLNIKVEEFSIKNQDEEIEPYFLVYAKTDTIHIYADGVNYYSLTNVKAYLEVDKLEDEVARNLESILKENGVAYTSNIEYIPDDRLFELLYEFTVIDG